MENKNKVESLDNNEVEKVAGGADTSRDKKIEEMVKEMASKLPPRQCHKVKIFCYECRKSYDWWMEPHSFGGRVVCPKCRSNFVRIEDTKEIETKNEKTK